MKKNYFGISRDHSGSMHSVALAATVDYNNTIAEIKAQMEQHSIDTIVSVMKCGTRLPDGTTVNLFEAKNSSVAVLQPIKQHDYDTQGGHTPLWDSIMLLIEQMKQVPDAGDDDVSFVIMAITDGADYRSKLSIAELVKEINKLQQTDRWTFIFRVPKGYASQLVRHGLPAGNILEWETTAKGMETSSAVTQTGLRQFYADRAAGVKSTTKFFSNMADVSIADVKKQLVDISSHVNLWTVQAKSAIRPFCEQKSGKAFVKGAAFYQLMKTEDAVQDYKQVVVRHRPSGAIYGGPSARSVLGLPSVGTVKVQPGDHGDYDIFLQSTSVNRALPAGTMLLYWPGHNQLIPVAAQWPFQTPPVATAVPTPIAPKTAAPSVQPVKGTFVKGQGKTNTTIAQSVQGLPPIAYREGYSAGFDAGKAKSAVRTASGLLAKDYQDGYAAGYKDGRGKQKRLYK